MMKRISSELLKGLPVQVESNGLKPIKAIIDHLSYMYDDKSKPRVLFLLSKKINEGCGAYFTLDKVIFI